MPATKRKAPSINLLPSDEGDSSLVSRVIRWILGTFRVLVIMVELVVILGFLSRFYLDSRNSDLTDEINQKKALLESYLPFEQDFKNTQKRLAIFSNYAYGQPLFEDYMTQITSHLPSDLQLTRVTRTGPNITIVVVGRSEQSIANYTAQLQSEPLTQTMSIISIEGVESSPLIQATLKTNLEVAAQQP